MCCINAHKKTPMLLKAFMLIPSLYTECECVRLKIEAFRDWIRRCFECKEWAFAMTTVDPFQNRHTILSMSLHIFGFNLLPNAINVSHGNEFPAACLISRLAKVIKVWFLMYVALNLFKLIKARIANIKKIKKLTTFLGSIPMRSISAIRTRSS